MRRIINTTKPPVQIIMALAMCLFFLLLPSIVSAQQTTLGSVGAGTYYLELSPGQSQTVELSFFNLGDKTIYLDLESDDNPDIEALVIPEVLTLPRAAKTSTPDSAHGKKWLVLDGGKTYIETKSASVHVYVPKKKYYTRNTQEIRVRAVTRAESSSGTGMKQFVAQSREYIFKVNLLGVVPNPETEDDKTYNRTNSSIPLSEQYVWDYYDTEGYDDTATVDKNIPDFISKTQKNQETENTETPEQQTGAFGKLENFITAMATESQYSGKFLTLLTIILAVILIKKYRESG